MISAFFPRPTFSNFDLKAKEARLHRDHRDQCRVTVTVNERRVLSFSYSCIIAMSPCPKYDIIPAHHQPQPHSQVPLICSPLQQQQQLLSRWPTFLYDSKLLRPQPRHTNALSINISLNMEMDLYVGANADKSMQVFTCLLNCLTLLTLITETLTHQS